VRRHAVAALFGLLLGVCASGDARADNKFQNPVLTTGALPPAVRAVDLEEQLGRRLDPSLAFTDMDGRRVRLGETITGDAPVVLVLAYYRCPMLCGLVLAGVVDGMNDLSLRLGKDYRALTVSFDPRDTPERARAKRASTLAALTAPAEGAAAWPFLVGGEAATRALADAVGFRYAYDARTDQYAHPAAIVILTPDGRVSRYLYGTSFLARDLRLALVEASQGRTGTIVDRVLLTCYRYDPATRAYGPFILGFMRLGGGITLVVVGGLLAALFWRDSSPRSRTRRQKTGTGTGRAGR
jgi:protein SCO1/2